jgi:putative sugar O-methyltransferase
MARTSISDFDGIYLQGVKAALEDERTFESFKRHPGIQSTVENVNPIWGGEYRDITLAQTPALLEHIDKFKENDTLGNPTLAAYPEGLISPTTWRYIKVVSDLQMLFGPLDGFDIVEIGAGYGGQCKILNDACDVSSYTIFDLDLPSALASKYLSRLGSPATEKLRLADFRRLGHDDGRQYDLVISNWAFSECTRAMQDTYIAHVLRRSRRGYITYNQMSHPYGIDSYRKHELIEALGFPVVLMAEGLKVEVPAENEFFILHWCREAVD